VVRRAHRGPGGAFGYFNDADPLIAAQVSGVIGLTCGKPLAALAKVAKTLGEDPQAKSDMIRTDAAGGTGVGYSIAAAYVFGPKTSSYTFTDLIPDTLYYAYVYAFNASGGTTPGGVPITPK
jgi:hypothetical protein